MIPIGVFSALVVVAAIAGTSADDPDSDVAAVDPGTDAEGLSDGTVEGSTTTSQAEVVGGSEAEDVMACALVDAETMTIEVVNQSPNTSSYILTVAFLDDGGQRLGDTTEFLNFLRPAERAVEEFFLFDELGTSCEVIEVERFLADSDPGEMAEVSPCQIGGADVLGDVTATLTATNGTPETSDYDITAAILDPSGTRIGTGFTIIEAVRAGESAPSDLLIVTDFVEGLTCEVVHVDRTASL